MCNVIERVGIMNRTFLCGIFFLAFFFVFSYVLHTISTTTFCTISSFAKFYNSGLRHAYNSHGCTRRFVLHKVHSMLNDYQSNLVNLIFDVFSSFIGVCFFVMCFANSILYSCILRIKITQTDCKRCNERKKNRREKE